MFLINYVFKILQSYIFVIQLHIGGLFMKLNENEKNILRATIEKKLQVVPIGERIKIRKDILEEILFESFEVFNIKGSGKLEY